MESVSRSSSPVPAATDKPTDDSSCCHCKVAFAGRTTVKDVDLKLKCGHHYDLGCYRNLLKSTPGQLPHCEVCREQLRLAPDACDRIESLGAKACSEGNLYNLRKVLKVDPSIIHKLCRTEPDNPDDLGNLLTIVAASKGHNDCLKRLINENADANAPRTEGGTTPLMAATRFNQVGCVKILLDAKADPNICTTDERETALHIAAHRGYQWCLELLIKAGADCNAAMKSGATALILAADYGCIDCMNVLRKAGADCDATVTFKDAPAYGKTALDIAASKGLT